MKKGVLVSQAWVNKNWKDIRTAKNSTYGFIKLSPKKNFNLQVQD